MALTASREGGLFTAAAFVVGFLVAHFVATVLPVPLLWYLPLEARFALTKPPSIIGMDFYGRVLLDLAAGGLFALVASRLARRWPEARARRAQRVAFTWALILGVLCAGLWAAMLLGRAATPELPEQP